MYLCLLCIASWRVFPALLCIHGFLQALFMYMSVHHVKQGRPKLEVPSCSAISHSGSSPTRISPQGRLIKSVSFLPHRKPTQQREQSASSANMNHQANDHAFDTFRAWKQGKLHADVPSYTRSQPGLASALKDTSPDGIRRHIADVGTQPQARHPLCTAVRCRVRFSLMNGPSRWNFPLVAHIHAGQTATTCGNIQTQRCFIGCHMMMIV